MFTADRNGRPTMTTEYRRTSVVRGALTWSLAPIALVIVLAAIVDGGAGAVGALIGGVSTLVVLGAGTWLVVRVAQASPTASLLAALCVFTAQGGLLLATLAIVSATLGSPELTWCAAAVIAATVVWTSAFGFFVRRERIPLFDLSGAGSS